MTVMSSSRSRRGATVLLAALLVAMLLPASPAWAYVPSGCLQTATQSNSWSNNCWVGQYSPYDKYGDYQVAIQRILEGRGYYSSSVDGAYGPGTESAVESFQANNSLAVDGIVGSNTAERLRTAMAYCGTFVHGSITSTQYEVPGMPCGWISQDDTSTATTWMVVERTDSCWKPVSVYGPSNGC